MLTTAAIAMVMATSATLAADTLKLLAAMAGGKNCRWLVFTAEKILT